MRFVAYFNTAEKKLFRVELKNGADCKGKVTLIGCGECDKR